ncbi:MAG: hypothetical protein AAFO62_12135, partial [Pseudomonadota bacterium]
MNQSLVRPGKRALPTGTSAPDRNSRRFGGAARDQAGHVSVHDAVAENDRQIEVDDALRRQDRLPLKRTEFMQKEQ